MILPSQKVKINLENKETETPNFINDFFANIGRKLAEIFSQEWSFDVETVAAEMDTIVTNDAEIEQLCNEINISKASVVPSLSLKGIYPEFQVIRGFSQKIPAGLLSYDQIHS